MDTNRVSSPLNHMGQEIWETAEAHGFHEPLPPGIGEKAVQMLLMISEICEAFDALRKDLGVDAHNEEIADTLIRVLHYAKSSNIDIDAEVDRKMTINAERPYKHGKVF